MHSKVFYDWLPSYIEATRAVLEIFKMAGYFPDSPRIPFDWLEIYLFFSWTKKGMILKPASDHGRKLKSRFAYLPIFKFICRIIQTPGMVGYYILSYSFSFVPTCLSLYISISLSIHLFIYLPIHLNIYLPIYLPTQPSTYYLPP